MAGPKLVVTGASGHVGKRVVELLLESGAAAIVAATRTPESLASYAARGVDVRRADFDDDATLIDAFAGAERILLVSTDRLERSARRAEQHVRAVRAAERAGAKHLVYTSLPNPYASPIFIAEDHARTEDALVESKLEYTILRNTLYAENLLGVLPAALASGRLIDAKESGAIAWVTREDCARTAAAVLLSNEGGRRRLDVTGPEPISSTRLAEIASALAKRPLAHVPVAAAALLQGMKDQGVPALLAELYASFDVAAARGDFANVSDTVPRLTGKPAQTIEAFLRVNRAVLV